MEISRTVRELLAKRGLTDEKEIQEYLSVRPRLTYDPFLLKGMKEAVSLIQIHRDRGSRICIYGDYDCDGVSAIYVLKQALSQMMDKDLIDHYIPSRFYEGYGLKNSAIDTIFERGTKLIITVDCGISQYNEAEYAKSLGMDIIITDHHNPAERIPDCIVIDPKQSDCPYPFDGLCGCGVAFKIAQALQRTEGFPVSVIHRLLDIAGIATIGDVVPLNDENRTIAKYGLYEIRTGRRKCICDLLDIISRNYRTIDSYGVSFGIVPNINAAGRMASAETALKLLESQTAEEAGRAARELASYNQERKDVQESAYKRGLELIEKQCPGSSLPVICDALAHEGIVGIVAGKLADKLERPVIVLTKKDGKYKGSGRSFGTIDLFDIVSRHCDLLERFGGHAAACGLTISDEISLKKFREALEREMQRLQKEDPSLLEHKEYYDMTIDISEVNLDVAEEIECMEPFGNSNEKPVFRLENVQLCRGCLVGEKKNHLKFTAEKGGRRIECISFFGADDHAGTVFEEPQADITGTISVNEYRGRKSVQFITYSVKPCTEGLYNRN